MKPGDTAKLIGVPPNVCDGEELQTRTLFEECLGQSFVVAAVESFEGMPFPLARIEVGHMIGKEPWEHTLSVRARVFGTGGSLKKGFECNGLISSVDISLRLPFTSGF